MNTRLYNVFDKHFDFFLGLFILIANKSNPWARQQPCLFDYTTESAAYLMHGFGI